MSPDEQANRGPEEERVREALRDLPPVSPDPGFRERLKDEFVSGRLAPKIGPAPEASGFSWGGLARWLLVPAAAVLLIALVPVFNRGPGWTVFRTSESGFVLVDGERIAVGSKRRIESLLDRGGRMRLSEEAEIDLLCGDILAVELAPGTEAALPPPPGRWYGRNVEGEVLQGELRVVTGPGFAGDHLIVTTPDATVELRGTTVSVYRDSMATCVCVHEGEALIGTGPEDLEPVPAGMRKVFMRGQEPFVTDIMAEHEQGLLEFRARLGDRLER
jgi:hypothetical protein